MPGSSNPLAWKLRLTGSLVRAWQGLNRVSVSIAAGAMLTGTLHPEGDPMFKAKIGAGLAVTAALVLGAGPALAATGWTTVSIPPTGDNAYTLSVSADSNTDAWAVGTANRAGADAGPLIDHWNGTSWSQATAPSYPPATWSTTTASAPPAPRTPGRSGSTTPRDTSTTPRPRTGTAAPGPR